MKKLDIRYHHGYPDHAKVVGLDVISIPLCEGGGHALPRDFCDALQIQRERLE